MYWTIDNWKSEYKRLELCYKRLSDAESSEAKAIYDHMCAVWQIIKELELV